MLGMYDTMRQGVNGFSFTAKDMDADLEMSDKWERLVNTDVGQDRWPVPNNKTETYEFGYCYGLKRFIGFDWIDYRGGVLKEVSSAEGYAELLNFFKQSACIFICVPGNLLTTPIKGRESSVRRNAAIDRINLFISHNFPDHVRPAIAIVITKCDLMIGKRDTDEVIEDMKQLFNPLFAPGSRWPVMICPVSLGPELSNNPAKGEISPMNVYLPVAYAAYQAFKEDLIQARAARGETVNRKEKLEKKFLSSILYGKDLGDLDKALKYNQERIEQIENHMRPLIQELMAVASTYYDGEEVSL